MLYHNFTQLIEIPDSPNIRLYVTHVGILFDESFMRVLVVTHQSIIIQCSLL